MAVLLCHRALAQTDPSAWNAFPPALTWGTATHLSEPSSGVLSSAHHHLIPLSVGSGALVPVTLCSNGCLLVYLLSIWPCVASLPPQHILLKSSHPALHINTPTPNAQHIACPLTPEPSTR